MNNEVVRIHDQLASEALFPSGVFSLAMLNRVLNEPTSPEGKPSKKEVIINEYNRMTLLNADSSQIHFQLNDVQVTQIEAFLSDASLGMAIARKMNSNSELVSIKNPLFNELHKERPRSAFFYLIKDESQREVLVILEGLVRPDGTAKLHDDLRQLATNQMLMRQVVASNYSQIVRSGHVWGNIIYTDCTLSPNRVSALPSERWMDKLERILLREGYVVFGPQGQLAKEKLLKELLK